MKIKIYHESVIPLHEQLLNQLRQFILSGRWPPERRIPSETELQRELKISRSTIRQALRNAEIEGLIKRVPGRGTFVTNTHSRNNTQRLIAFLVFDFDRYIQRRLLSGAESAARAAGYRVIFCNSHSDVEEEERMLDQLHQDGVDGILLWPNVENGNPERLAKLSRRDFPPVTMMDRTFEGVEWDYVASDNYSGAYAAVQHLIELGHHRIAFLSCRILELLPIAERMRAYQTALQDAGLEPLPPWLIGRPNQELLSANTMRAYRGHENPAIHQISNYFQTSPKRPTAIFAMNDNMALLALKAASVAGLHVPDDVSIIGFDDMDMMSHLSTPLTTVAQDSFAIGKRAAELLIERIEGRYGGAPRSELMLTDLRVRDSTSEPPLSP